MSFITIRKSIQQDWQRLFALVLDLERYPQFVPHCARVSVISRRVIAADTTEIISRMTVGLLPLQLAYTNRTLATPAARRITVDSTDGPLQHLHVLWRFEPNAGGGTDVTLTASYVFRNPILSAMAAKVFERLFSQMVDAFERRATQQPR